MSSQPNSLRAVFFALAANVAIFLAKLAAALLTGSGAMLAEAVHSAADCGNQLLLLRGMRQARQPPSEDYPLGWGRALYFWSFLVAMLLFSVGGVFSIYEGVHKLAHPEPLKWPWLALAVLIFGVLAEGSSMWGCLREIAHERRGRSLGRWFRETRSSDLLVVFGEDLAALIGLAVALAAVVATVATGNPLYDGLGTIAIGVLLVVVAVAVAVEVKALLIGQGVEPLRRAQMLAFLGARAEVDHVYSLLTLQLGREAMVAVKARMVPAASDRALVQAINVVERAFREGFPEVRWCFFEPDIAD